MDKLEDVLKKEFQNTEKVFWKKFRFNITQYISILKRKKNLNYTFKILHLDNKSLKLNLVENLEINRLKRSGSLSNDQVKMSNSPLLKLFDSGAPRWISHQTQQWNQNLSTNRNCSECNYQTHFCNMPLKISILSRKYHTWRSYNVAKRV